MESLWLGIIGAFVVGVILLILEYRSPWFARLRESLRSKRDSASKAVNFTVQAPGQNSSASIQEVKITQLEKLVINQPQRVTEAQSAGAPPVVEYRSHPTPMEMAEQMNGLPLFQRESARKYYLGLKVDWTLQFFSIHETATKGVYRVMADKLDAGSQMVQFEVDISKYPEFKILEKGHRLRVVGEISDVQELLLWVFSLSNCVVKVE